MKYLVRVDEIFSKTVAIEAESRVEAQDKAEYLYEGGEIKLGDRDYDGYEVEVGSVAKEEHLEKLEVY